MWSSVSAGLAQRDKLHRRSVISDIRRGLTPLTPLLFVHVCACMHTPRHTPKHSTPCSDTQGSGPLLGPVLGPLGRAPRGRSDGWRLSGEQQRRERLPSRSTVRDWILHDASVQDDTQKSRSVTTWSTSAWQVQDSGLGRVSRPLDDAARRALETDDGLC